MAMGTKGQSSALTPAHDVARAQTAPASASFTVERSTASRTTVAAALGAHARTLGIVRRAGVHGCPHALAGDVDLPGAAVEPGGVDRSARGVHQREAYG